MRAEVPLLEFLPKVHQATNGVKTSKTLRLWAKTIGNNSGIVADSYFIIAVANFFLCVTFE
jgi:hypothetical protein